MKEREEKTEGGEIVIRHPALVWLENFWYHYKWTVIVIGFFVAVFAFCFSQCASKTQSGVKLALAGGYSLTGEEQAALTEVLEAVVPDKVSGDKTDLTLNIFSFYTEEELTARCTDPETGKLKVSLYNNAKSVNQDQLTNFTTYVKTGDSAVWFVSPHLYGKEGLDLAQRAVALSELFEATPQGAVDGYAVRLGDTEIYAYYDALKVLPADTLIVFPHSLALWGESSNEETYEQFKAIYRAIINFKKP